GFAGMAASTMRAHEGNSGFSMPAVAAPVESRVPKLAPPPPDAATPGIRHPLFLRWVLFQSIVATLLTAAGLADGGRLPRASLVVVPLILAVLTLTSGYAGLLAWRADVGVPVRTGLRHLWFSAGVCQLLGLLGTVAGFYAMFETGGSTASTATAGSSDL